MDARDRGGGAGGPGAPRCGPPPPQRRPPSTSAPRALRPARAGRRIHACDQGAVVVRLPSDAELGAPPTTIERRLEITTDTTMIRTAPTAMSTRAVVFAPSPTDRLTTAGAMSRATRFMTLISGLIAGPAVSLKGSPTVSPMTVAAWASLPFPP